MGNKPEFDDAFGDEDDDFDQLLSQIDTTEVIQSSSSVTILSKKTLHQSNCIAPISTVEIPRNDRVMLPPSSQNTTTTFKRYNSDNTDTRQNQVRIRNNSGTVMKSWQRSQSSPEGIKKCTKEEIERKRLAAIKRCNEKSQKKCSKEEIEKKRLAAI